MPENKVDIVFVIDATGSMGPIIDRVKERALTLCEKISAAAEAVHKPLAQLRFRVIDFADFATEGDEAIRQTDFFTMPEDKYAFENAVKNIEYEYRGGDIPENGLEALFVAINSDWVKLQDYEKGAHIIMLMTDAVPLHLGERDGSLCYDASDYPANVEEMEEVWNDCIKDNATRCLPRNVHLFLLAPTGTDGDGHTWERVAKWQNTVFIPTDDGNGLCRTSVDDILELIAQCIENCT